MWASPLAREASLLSSPVVLSLLPHPVCGGRSFAGVPVPPGANSIPIRVVPSARASWRGCGANSRPFLVFEWFFNVVAGVADRKLTSACVPKILAPAGSKETGDYCLRPSPEGCSDNAKASPRARPM